MAYQINGNVVIDDSGNGIFENLALVQKPTNVDPTEGENVYGSNITLLFSNFATLYPNVAHSYTVFEVANASSFASANIVHSGNVDGSNTVYFDSNVVIDTFYWRAKYIDDRGNNSEYSLPTSFTLAGLTVPPDGLGCPFQGGYFSGNIDIGGGVCYYIVVSPNSTGCACCQWRPTRTVTSGVTSTVNGFTNTYGPLDNANHPAGNWTATRTIDGFTDWYLPSQSEVVQLYTNKGSMPVGEGYASGLYWSSTQGPAGPGGQRIFSPSLVNGCPIYSDYKEEIKRLRAVRRVPK